MTQLLEIVPQKDRKRWHNNATAADNLASRAICSHDIVLFLFEYSSPCLSGTKY